MTQNQKAFAAWVQEFKDSCAAHGSPVQPDGESCWRARFETKLGGLIASIHTHKSEYESHTKRGFVSIYMRFAYEVDVRPLKAIMPGEFNGFSGKWNIHISGGKADIAAIRQRALYEFEKRLNFCNQQTTETGKE